MGIQIEGAGIPNGVQVNPGGRIKSISISDTAAHHANHHDGRSYSAVVNKTPTGANDCFFFIQNLSDEELIFDTMFGHAASAEEIDIYLDQSGTRSGGTVLTMRAMKTNVPVLQTTDVTVESGVDITGLTGGGSIGRFKLPTTQSATFTAPTSIILTKGGTLSIYAVTGAIEIDLTLLFHYETEENYE